MGEHWVRFVEIISANRLTRGISGWGAWLLSDWAFDHILYPIAIFFLGPYFGGGLMTVIATTINYFWGKAVIASGKDWFEMKSAAWVFDFAFKVIQPLRGIGVKQSWLDGMKSFFIFMGLSLSTDPMITTLYFRRDDKSMTYSRKDLRILFSSAILSNTWWTLVNWGGIELVKIGWKLDWVELFSKINLDWLLSALPLWMRILKYFFE